MSLEENDNDENQRVHIPYANVNSDSKLSNSVGRRNSSNNKSDKKSKNPIEKWLKTRFRDGFLKMKTSFEEIDRQKTGQVNKESIFKYSNIQN